MNMIKGNVKPKAEEKTTYEVDTFFPEFKNYFLDRNKEDTYIWKLYKNKNGQWHEVVGNVKYGKSVPYTFGEKVVGIPFKIVVHKEVLNFLNQKETSVFAQLVVVPKSKVEPTIGRVILINKGNSNVNKATFNEVLTAEARTTGLIGREITFYMWEEGTAEAEKYKKPRKGFVDKNGIARTTFSLVEYASANTLVGFFTGGANETKKFFVTAVYETKKATNKGAVVVADEQSKPQPEKKAEGDKSGVYGGIEKMAEIVGNGVSNIMDSITSLSASVVDSATIQNTPSTCICKEQYKDLVWGEKVSCEFRKKIVEIANRLGKDPNLLMAGMALETGRTFSPTAGKGTSYVGLIQFGDSAAESVGTTRAELLNMSAIQQLDYVERYLYKKKDKINTLTDFYLSILMPVDVGKGNQLNHVVFDNEYPLAYKKDGKSLTDLSKSRHYGYRQNPSFLHENGEKKKWKDGGGKKYNGPGKTYIWEIEKSISNFYDEGKLHTVKVFSCNKSEETAKPSLETGTWNVVITEKYTGSRCTHVERTPIRANCRRGKIEIYDHNKNIVLTITDCLLEGIAGEDRTVTDSDAPFGVYQIASTPFIMGSSSGKKRTAYGPNPRLSFEPIEGSGDEADKSGRSLIRIHGGRQETESFQPRKNPYLMRTHGCIRILDQDAKKFYDWWTEYHKSNPNIKPGKLTLKK